MVHSATEDLRLQLVADAAPAEKPTSGGITRQQPPFFRQTTITPMKT